MEIISSENENDKPPRGRLQAAVRTALNETGVQLSLLQRRVGARLGLKDADLECLNVIAADGPFTPTALARRIGVHPATLTGILDRLERQNWIARERDPDDRRAVRVRALKDRNRELYDLLGGMNTRMDEILGDLDDVELSVVAAFLERTTRAGRAATEDLTG